MKVAGLYQGGNHWIVRFSPDWKGPGDRRYSSLDELAGRVLKIKVYGNFEESYGDGMECISACILSGPEPAGDIGCYFL